METALFLKVNDADGHCADSGPDHIPQEDENSLPATRREKNH